MNHKTLKQRVLNYIQSLKSDFSLPELKTSFNDEVSERTLRRWLVQWVEEGLLIRTGQKRATRYQYQPKSQPLIGFLNNVPKEQRAYVLAKLRDIWTYSSTSLEGNTLTQGETFEVLEYGLTIAGKPLKDHQEVVGHARAIELVYQLVSSNQPITAEHLFELHKAVQTEKIMDIYAPVGEWKNEPNGTNALDSEGQHIFIQYALPQSVPNLMAEWLDFINTCEIHSLNEAIETYAKAHIGFVHIHPFADGNGRMARLLANIPLLKSGYPPLVIDAAQRRHYIHSLARYQIEAGQLNTKTGVWPQHSNSDKFIQFCADCYEQTRQQLKLN